MLSLIFYEEYCNWCLLQAIQYPLQDCDIAGYWLIHSSPLFKNHLISTRWPSPFHVSSSWQVDDLKAKLAAQEVELKQKNEDADKLIQARTFVFAHRLNRTDKCRYFPHFQNILYCIAGYICPEIFCTHPNTKRVKWHFACLWAKRWTAPIVCHFFYS